MTTVIVFEEFSPKDPAEDLVLSMDFTNILGTEAVTACTWTCAVSDGVDAAPSSLISGACDFSATPIVKQRVIGGVDGVTYHLKATVTTNSTPARILVGTGVLHVLNGA